MSVLKTRRGAERGATGYGFANPATQGIGSCPGHRSVFQQTPIAVLRFPPLFGAILTQLPIPETGRRSLEAIEDELP